MVRMMVSTVAHLVSKSDGKATLEVAGRPMFELNPVGVIVWDHLVAGLQPDEIVRQLVARFHIPEERAVNDVTKFMELLKENLLVYDDI
jgi:Coenzyme PQQ synthesis protein D (PqqD)